jgi:hypothetical protein
MRPLRLGAVAVLALGLAGCLDESKHPVGPADPENGDPRLLGAWYNVAEDGFAVAHVFATESGALDIEISDHDVEGTGGVVGADAHVTRLPHGDYLNILVTGAESGYLIARYRFDGLNRVAVAMTETAALLEAVKSGALAGTITEEASGPDLHITATSEQWQAFLAGPPADLYGEEIVFERVGPAYVSE